MPAWLVEGDPTVYAVFGVAFVLSTAMWGRTRQRKWAVAAGVSAALIGGYFALDRAVESDNEQVVRKVRAVAAAISAKDIEGAFRNVSETFNRGGVTKDQFRTFAQRMTAVGNVTDVQVWD